MKKGLCMCRQALPVHMAETKTGPGMMPEPVRSGVESTP